MAAPEESIGDEHRYFVQQEAPVAEDEQPRGDEPEVVEAPPVEVEIAGLRRIQVGAIAGLIGIGLAVLVTILLVFVIGIAIGTATNGGSTASIYTTVEVFILSLFIGVSLLVISFILYVAGFAKLRRADRRFGAPVGLAVVGLIGFLILEAFVAYETATLFQIIGCGPPPVSPNCATLAAMPLDPTILLAGLVIGIVGWVGIVLGLYRVGRRYSSTVTRVGAILYAIPVVEIVAPLLILIGTSGIIRRLRGSVASAPPPSEPAPVDSQPPEEPPAAQDG